MVTKNVKRSSVVSKIARGEPHQQVASCRLRRAISTGNNLLPVHFLLIKAYLSALSNTFVPSDNQYCPSAAINLKALQFVMVSFPSDKSLFFKTLQYVCGFKFSVIATIPIVQLLLRILREIRLGLTGH